MTLREAKSNYESLPRNYKKLIRANFLKATWPDGRSRSLSTFNYLLKGNGVPLQVEEQIIKQIINDAYSDYKAVLESKHQANGVQLTITPTAP